MSLPRPICPYHFHADLIWWDGPFKSNKPIGLELENISLSEKLEYLVSVIIDTVFKYIFDSLGSTK
jgi:hypothetical protein